MSLSGTENASNCASFEISHTMFNMYSYSGLKLNTKLHSILPFSCIKWWKQYHLPQKAIVNMKWYIQVKHVTATAKSLQSCPTLCNPIDGSPPGSPILGILQARVLEWGAIAFSWKWVLSKCRLATAELISLVLAEKSKSQFQVIKKLCRCIQLLQYIYMFKLKSRVPNIVGTHYWGQGLNVGFKHLFVFYTLLTCICLVVQDFIFFSFTISF